VVAAVGAVGQVRWPLGRLLLRAAPSARREAALQRRAFPPAGTALPRDAVLVGDAGCGVAALLTEGVPRCVARVARHCTARRHVLPASPGRGRRPSSGERVRPLPRTHQGRTLAASPPDTTAQWGVAGRTIPAQVGESLGRATAQPGAPVLRCAVLHDPRDQEPWGLATTLPVSASALWGLSRDRWPSEPRPLAAKPMVGAHRACVCGDERRHRRPE
jgi:hypothetical protein